MVDCDTKEDEGCDGGLQEDAFDYLKTHGFMLESKYPYKAGDGKERKCKYNAADTYGNVKSWSAFSKDEGEIASGCA